jgi:hypothetical protein
MPPEKDAKVPLPRSVKTALLSLVKAPPTKPPI